MKLEVTALRTTRNSFRVCSEARVVRGRLMFVGRIRVFNVGVVAETVGDVGEFLNRFRGRHALGYPVGDHSLTS